MKQILFIISILIIASCNPKKKDENKLHRIDLSTPEGVILASDYFSYVKIIKVDSSQIIGNYSKVIEHEGKYLISDSRQTKSIYCINRVGNLIFKICSVGKGPGEYMRISDFAINPNNNTIILFSGRDKILYFSLVDGHLIKEEKLDILVEEIAVQNNGNILLYSSDNKNTYNGRSFLPGILSYNPTSKKLDQIYTIHNLKLADKLPRVPRTLNGFGDNIIFSPAISDTVYTINNDSVLPLFIYNLGENHNIVHSAKSNNKVAFTYTQYMGEQTVGYSCIYNINTRQAVTGMGVQNDINHLNFSSLPSPFKDGFIYAIDASALLNYQTAYANAIKTANKDNINKLKDTYTKLTNTIDSLNISVSDNKILSICKLK